METKKNIKKRELKDFRKNVHHLTGWVDSIVVLLMRGVSLKHALLGTPFWNNLREVIGVLRIAGIHV